MKKLYLIFALLFTLTCGKTPEAPEQVWAPSGYSKITQEYVGNTFCQVFDFYETWDEGSTPKINKVIINIPPLGADQDQHLYNAFYDGVNSLLLTYDVLEAAFEWPVVKAAANLVPNRFHTYDSNSRQWKWRWTYTLRVWLQQKSGSSGGNFTIFK